jgi:hypothetical protein
LHQRLRKGKVSEQKYVTGEKKKERQQERTTHIIRGNHRRMGLQGNLDFFGLLRVFDGSGLGLRNFLYRGSGSPWSNIWLDRIVSRQGRRR